MIYQLVGHGRNTRKNIEMVGLVFVDRLMLSPAQWGAILGSMGMYLYAYHKGFSLEPVIFLSQGLLFMVCYGVLFATDTRLLFQSCHYLRQFTWRAFLSEFAHRDYVKLQPPFYIFFVSRYPVYHWHQCLNAVLAVLCGLLMGELYGREALLLLSTPVYALMSTQPGNDCVLFGLMLIVLRLLQRGKRGYASLLYGACFLIKPTMLLTIPFLVWKLRGWIVFSVGIIGVYLFWSSQYYFGVKQWDFLLQQLCIKKLFGL